MSPLAPRKKPVGRKKGMPALAIAAIVIIVPLLVTYYAFERHFPFLNSQYTDYAIVPNSVNVRSGSPVRIAGIDVGEVTGVSAARHGTKVAFALDSTALPLHTDATVTIRDRLFLEGGYYLALEPGSPNAPVAPQGFTIQRQDTQTPVQFFQVLSTFDLAARANLEQLLNTANAAFSQLPGLPITDSGDPGIDSNPEGHLLDQQGTERHPAGRCREAA
jgi:ABC-type transporter Mla subunit MlaD